MSQRASLVTLWAYVPDRECVHGYDEALALLKEGRTFDTTQVCMLHEPWVRDYDFVVIVERDGVSLLSNRKGDKAWDCIYTDRELRHMHNLWHLWKAGEFRGIAPFWSPR